MISFSANQRLKNRVVVVVVVVLSSGNGLSLTPPPIFLVDFPLKVVLNAP